MIFHGNGMDNVIKGLEAISVKWFMYAPSGYNIDQRWNVIYG